MTIPQLKALLYAIHNHGHAETESGRAWDLGASAYITSTHGDKKDKRMYQKGWEAAEQLYEEHKHLSDEQIAAIYERETSDELDLGEFE